MARKKVPAKQNERTGSYTVRVPKDARTGTFSADSKRPIQVVFSEPSKKVS